MGRIGLTRILPLLVALSACSDTPVGPDGDTTPTEPGAIFLLDASEIGGAPSVTGSGHAERPDGSLRNFIFSAQGAADGSASGNFFFKITEPVAGSLNPAVLTIRAKVTCAAIAGNRATIGGIVTASSNPDFLGLETGFSVIDFGEDPARALPDQISTVAFPSSASGYAADVCTGKVETPSFFRVAAGNIGVRSGLAPQDQDLLEDFGRFGEGELPTSPTPGYEYILSADPDFALSGLTSIVDGFDGTSLVRRKESDAVSVPLAPGFTIRSKWGAPLVGTLDGAVLLSADVRVDEGYFCSFLIARGPSDAAVAVYLHELDYEVGQPFSVEISIDMDTGTAIAFQDGERIALRGRLLDGTPVSGTSVPFPDQPRTFGFEGCTTLGQQYTVDNLLIAVR